MDEIIKDAKHETPVEDFDATAEKVLDEFEASSASKKGEQETDNQDTGVDQSKKANLDKETSVQPGPEAKLAKIKEILGDDEAAINAYIKSKGYHTDPAWQKLLAKSKEGIIDDDTKKQLDEFKKVTSSREYVETKMKSEGYKQEAIDAKLKEMGFPVQSKEQDDVELVIKSLGFDSKNVDEGTRATISDVAKVVDVILKDRLGKTLPERFKPLEESLTAIGRKDNAAKILSQMKGIVSEEGVLDYDKDITPAIKEWLNQNPTAQQEDVFDYFVSLNHSLSIERLKTGKKRADNQEVKNGLRKVTKSTGTNAQIPKKTGDFNTDADAVLDAIGYQ